MTNCGQNFLLCILFTLPVFFKICGPFIESAFAIQIANLKFLKSSCNKILCHMGKKTIANDLLYFALIFVLFKSSIFPVDYHTLLKLFSFAALVLSYFQAHELVYRPRGRFVSVL